MTHRTRAQGVVRVSDKAQRGNTAWNTLICASPKPRFPLKEQMAKRNLYLLASFNHDSRTKSLVVWPCVLGFLF